MILTQISYQKRNPDNVNLFIDNKFFCSVSINQMLELKLIKGMEVDELMLEEIESNSDENKVKEKLNRFLSLRPRSTKEVNDYLVYRKGVEQEQADKIIFEYIQKKYIDDDNFTKWFLEMRLSSGKHGINKIKNQLIEKGINKKLIDKYINSNDQKGKQVDQIKKLVEKFNNQIKEEDKYKKKQKIISRLLSRGFLYEDVKKVIG